MVQSPGELGSGQILLCGAIAGAVAKTVVAPFDRVKIHFQVQSPSFQGYWGRLLGIFDALALTYTKRGLQGLFDGHSATMLRVGPYAALNFFFYEKLKYFFGVRRDDKSWKRFMSGSFAGIFSTTITYPLDLIRVRMAYQRNLSDPKSSLRAVVEQLLEEGAISGGLRLSGLYQGYLFTIAGIIPYAGTSFYIYELLKQRRKDTVEGNLSVSMKLLLGMISGSIAQTVAYPFDTVRRRYQLYLNAPHLQVTKIPSYKNIAFLILKDSGWKGFFTGLSVNYLKVAPATGISFVVYELMKELMQNLTNTL